MTSRYLAEFMTAKLRLLWLTQNYAPASGGMAVSCDRIVRHLREKGVEIHLYHLKHGGSAKERYFHPTLGTDNQFPVGDVPAHGLNLLWHQLPEADFDAVVCYGTNVAMRAARVFSAWLNAPLVTLLRGNDFDLAVLDPKRFALLQDTLLASSLVLTVSKDKCLRAKSLFPQLNVHHIGNGLDFSLWRALEHDQQQAEKWRQQRQGKPVLGLFGHLKDKKGGKFFFDALLRYNLAERFQFLVAGELDDDTRSLLEGLPQEDVVQLPFMDRYQLIPWYLCCDVIAIPSFYDGTPNVLLEAASLSIPVIAAQCGGMDDLLNETNGWVFKPNDESQCVQTIASFLSSPETVITQKSQLLQQQIAASCCARQEAQRYFNYLTQMNKSQASLSA